VAIQLVPNLFCEKRSLFWKILELADVIECHVDLAETKLALGALFIAVTSIPAQNDLFFNPVETDPFPRQARDSKRKAKRAKGTHGKEVAPHQRQSS
jgi:hypothetical protein